MIETLRLFGKELPIDAKKVSFTCVNKLAVRVGYLVSSDACTDDVITYLKSKDYNPNSTFYKEWNDIIKKSRFELFIDQLEHYASTYGTDYTGETYIPNTGAENVPDFTKLKVITTISKDEVVDRVTSMLESGIALKEETITDLVSVIKKLEIDINIDNVKNKEANLIIRDNLGLIPGNPEEFVRFLIYKATKSTILIKDKKTIDAIKESNIDLREYIDSVNIVQVSSVFFRFKPILLAFRTNDTNKVIVNRLRRLANKYNCPKKQSFWTTALTKASNLEIVQHLSELNNFKKIALIEELMSRDKKSDYRSFVIRNQKLWINESNKTFEGKTPILNILYQSLISELSKKACNIRLPKDVVLTLPRSEKSFIGNYPMYSYLNMDENIISGIYWKTEWGASDLDLSFLNVNGTKIGWNADYNDGEMIYSGDMTDAEPEATELIYFPKGYKGTGSLHINRYTGVEGAKFKLFFAKEKITEMKRGYMVDHNNIILSVDDEMNSKEKNIGIIADGKFYFAILRTGNKQVSGHSVTDCFAQYVLDTKDCHLILENVLKEAGFTFVEGDEKADIDFSELSKDTFINLLV
jgi:hypothetical protein